MIRLDQVSKRYAPAVVAAVRNVSLTVEAGEAYGLVGESGSGKTTIGRMLLALEVPSSGRVLFRGEEVSSLRGGRLREYRRHVQAVFQDPYEALSPRQRVEKIVGEPLSVHRLCGASARARRVAELLRSVGLPEEAAARFPHQFSGGQRQRIAIARALALEPDFLVLDEPVSALDVSIQSQVINLLRDLRSERRLGYLFISHNLAVVAYLCDRIGVMYAGCLVEEGWREDVLCQPQHPYTRELLDALPGSGRLLAVPGPTLAPPAAVGCPFRHRCPYMMEICCTMEPRIRPSGAGHRVACHLYEEAS